MPGALSLFGLCILRVSSGFSSFTDSVSRDSHFLMGGGDVVNSVGYQFHWGVLFILLHWDAGVSWVLIGTLAGLVSL